MMMSKLSFNNIFNKRDTTQRVILQIGHIFGKYAMKLSDLKSTSKIERFEILKVNCMKYVTNGLNGIPCVRG